MSISPWLQGSRDVMYITLSPIPESFVSPSMTIRDRTGYAADVAGTGVFNILNLATGSVSYTPSVADVATPGDYLLFLQFYDFTGTVPYRRTLGQWLLLPV
jgi:hypothetical protein